MIFSFTPYMNIQFSFTPGKSKLPRRITGKLAGPCFASLSAAVLQSMEKDFSPYPFIPFSLFYSVTQL